MHDMQPFMPFALTRPPAFSHTTQGTSATMAMNNTETMSKCIKPRNNLLSQCEQTRDSSRRRHISYIEFGYDLVMQLLHYATHSFSKKVKAKYKSCNIAEHEVMTYSAPRQIRIRHANYIETHSAPRHSCTNCNQICKQAC